MTARQRIALALVGLVAVAVVFSMFLGRPLGDRARLERLAGSRANVATTDAKFAAASPVPGEADAYRADEAPADAVGRQLRHDVSLCLLAADTDRAAEQAQQRIKSLGGFVTHMGTRRVDNVMHYDLVLRVPSARVDEAVAALRGVATRVESESRQVEDVTQTVVDIEARLRALRATEKELMSLLAESRARARKVDEIMSTYRELTGIRSQIESLEGLRRTLAHQVALATLRLSILPTPTSVPVTAAGWRPVEELRGAARVLVGLLQGLGTLAIYALVVGVPVALLALGLMWPALKLARRVRRAA
jgi:hypothetical protein